MTSDSQFVTADYLRRSGALLGGIKAASYDRMEIAPGDTVLDAGCGPGLDAVALAGRVGPAGRVIGVDADPAMLAEARQLAAAEGVAERLDLREASVLALPLPEGAVAASRAERLIQVLPPACEAQVVAELRRVTRAGGRVVLLDADWGSASIDYDDHDLERRLFAFFARTMRPNGFAGRRLLRLAAAAGLVDLSCEPFPRLHRELAGTPVEWMAEGALAQGVISEREQRQFLADLRAREAAGTLYILGTMVLVSGRVPGSPA